MKDNLYHSNMIDIWFKLYTYINPETLVKKYLTFEIEDIKQFRSICSGYFAMYLDIYQT